MSSWDHPAHPGCFLVVRELRVGEICVLCYHHALAYVVVRVIRDDVPVCQGCSNALAARGCLKPGIVRSMMAIMLRRLSFDNVTARGREMIENYEIDEHTVVH